MLMRIETATSRRVYRGMKTRVERLEADLIELVRERLEEETSQPERTRAHSRRRTRRRRSFRRHSSFSSSSSNSPADDTSTGTETETDTDCQPRKKVRLIRRGSGSRRDA